MSLSDLTQEKANELFIYNSHTGFLFYRKTGDRAGYRNKHLGCRLLSVKKHRYIEHRVIWLMHYGYWPKHTIDHINHIRDDNRLENLREATQAENLRNKRARTVNGISRDLPKGVYRKRNKFGAQICLDGKRITLGVFRTPEEASDVYFKAAQKLHGKFACRG
jgi:hypothetical protein